MKLFRSNHDMHTLALGIMAAVCLAFLVIVFSL